MSENIGGWFITDPVKIRWGKRTRITKIPKISIGYPLSHKLKKQGKI